MRGLRLTRGALWAVDLADTAACPPLASYQLREASADDAAAIDRAARLPDGTAGARLGRGSRAFVAVRDDEVVAWAWTSRGAEYAPPLGLTIRFGRDEAYVWDCETLPGHRDHGLFRALLRLVGRTLGAEGVRLVWCGIHDRNLASQRATGHAGWRPVLRTVALRVGSRPLLWLNPVRYADARLVERAYRVVGRAGRRRRPGTLT